MGMLLVAYRYMAGIQLLESSLQHPRVGLHYAEKAVGRSLESNLCTPMGDANVPIIILASRPSAYFPLPTIPLLSYACVCYDLLSQGYK